MGSIRDNFVRSGIVLLDSYRKKNYNKLVLEKLLSMKELITLVADLRHLLADENYPLLMQQATSFLFLWSTNLFNLIVLGVLKNRLE